MGKAMDKMMVLKTGDKAPDFKLADQQGNETKLSDFKGRKVVLYFYPKDDTPGCTKEACDFRDSMAQLKKLGAEVIGVSNDDEKSHQKFIEKFKLPFPLLCDVDKKVSSDYGVYGLKSFMGKEYYGIIRSTFIIDGNGIIEKIFYKANPERHAEEVISALKE